jgi:glucose/mannose-6-phosphate isomerase
MTPWDIAHLDRSGMYSRLTGFPDQVREALEIGRSAPLRTRASGIRQIVLCGLGGSAIGGDLLRSYLAGELKVPFLINRHYVLPRFVGPETLVIISSYSGDTEETNAAHREALKRHARLLCITSGGTTARLALRARSPLITLPGGFPPRAALGYSFFPLLIALIRMGAIRKRDRDLRETLTLLEESVPLYSAPDSPDNLAWELAQKLQRRISVIYSSTERFDAVSTRWRGQIAENAKALAFGNVIPEMNHNELVGWEVLRDQMREMQVIFLRDRSDHPRVQRRIDITRDLLRDRTPHVTEVWSQGRSLLARIFSLIVLGDWSSFYLSLLHGVDPTPVLAIDYLKTELAKL